MPKERAFEASHFAVMPRIGSLGVMIFDPVWGRKAHVDAHCELMYVIRGAVELVLGRRRYRAKAGEMLLVPAGQAHRDAFDFARGLQVFMVFFDWPPAKEFFDIASNRVIEQMPSHRKTEISRLVERLAAGGSGEAEADRLVAETRLLTILLLVLCEAAQGGEESAPRKPAGNRRGRALMLKARQYLQQNYARRISLEDIARDLGISAFHLSHVFSQESDFTLFSYLTKLRMEKARELLQGGMKVAAAARAVGYSDSSYFSKSFHRYFNALPGSVRRGCVKTRIV